MRIYDKPLNHACEPPSFVITWQILWNWSFITCNSLKEAQLLAGNYKFRLDIYNWVLEVVLYDVNTMFVMKLAEDPGGLSNNFQNQRCYYMSGESLKKKHSKILLYIYIYVFCIPILQQT